MLNKLYKKIMKDIDKCYRKDQWVVRTYKNVVTMVTVMDTSDQVTFYLEMFYEGVQYRVMSSSDGFATLWRDNDMLVEYKVDNWYVRTEGMFQLLVKAALETCLYK